MGKIIRRLTIDDYEEMLRVWSVSGLPFKPNGRESRAMLAAEISRDHCAFFGAFDQERLVGLAIADYDGRRGWVNRLAVDPDYRGIGLATDLMEKTRPRTGPSVMARTSASTRPRRPPPPRPRRNMIGYSQPGAPPSAAAAQKTK